MFFLNNLAFTKLLINCLNQRACLSSKVLIPTSPLTHVQHNLFCSQILVGENLLARLSSALNGLVDTKCHKDHGYQAGCRKWFPPALHKEYRLPPNGNSRFCKSSVPQRWFTRCYSAPGSTVPGAGKTAMNRPSLCMSPCMGRRGEECKQTRAFHLAWRALKKSVM